MPKFKCEFSTVCLPDYWGGHHLRHISVAVDNTTTKQQLLAALKSEVNEGAFGGSQPEPDDETHDELLAAVEAIEFKDGTTDDTLVFPDLPEQNDDNDYSIYTYFVFVGVEHE